MKLSAEKEAELGVQLLWMPLGLQNPPRIEGDSKDIISTQELTSPGVPSLLMRRYQF